jgi:MSHA biogenesis protein MshN
MELLAMSLINKMLKDLETRQNAPLGKPSSRPIFQDLHAVPEGSLTRWMFPALLIGAIALALVTGLYIWTHRGMQPPMLTNTQENQKLALTEPAVAAANEPAVPAAPSAASPVATPVSDAPMAATIQARATPEPAPDAATPVKPPVTTTARVAAPAASKPPVRVARPAPPRISVPITVPPAAQENAAASNMPDAGEVVDTNAPSGSMEKKNIPLTPEQTAENTYRVAAQQLQQRHLDEAEQGFKSALAINPRHVAARELLAGLLLQRTRMDEAQQVLEQGLAAVPGQAGFASLLARIYVEQNAEPKAILLLEQQHTGAKSNPDTLALLATLYQRAARHGEAIAAFKDALTLRPLEGKWWLGLGISQEAEQNWNEARFAYQRVRDTNVEPGLARYAEQRLVIVRTK